MFNLENKITWKELAPSLQAMFKTLQSQITDVKNEVNNINISLGDINDHLTQIDKDITNLENNITTIIQDTVEDVVGEMMFLNLSPKIGYYQEDKIEVISKYNMNIIDGNYKHLISVFRDNLNRYVLLFKGNDGSYNGTIGLYKATSQNTDIPLVFENTPIDLSKIVGNSNTLQNLVIYGLDDFYLALRTNQNSKERYFLINTNNSSYSDNWELVVEFTSFIGGIGKELYQVLYYPEYGTIMAVLNYSNPTNKAGYMLGTVYILKASDLSILQQVDLEHWSNYVYCMNTISFSPNKKVTWLRDPEAFINTNMWGWDGNGSYCFYRKHHCLMFVTNTYIYTWEGNDYHQRQYSYVLKMLYNVPEEVLKGNSSNITTMTGHGDNNSKVIIGYPGLETTMIYDSGNEVYKNVFAHNAFQDSVFKTFSYSSNNGIVFESNKNRDNNNITMLFIINEDDQFDNVNPNEYGSSKPPLVGKYNYLTPPDSSLWGKQIYKYVFLFDKTIVASSNSDGDQFLLVEKWQRTKDTESSPTPVIEPVPGYYWSIQNKEGFVKWYSASYYSYTKFNITPKQYRGTYGNRSYSNIINTDGSMRLFISGINSSYKYNEGDPLSVIETHFSGYGDDIKFTYTEVVAKTFTSQFKQKCVESFGTDNYLITNIFYNSLGNYLLFFGQSRVSPYGITFVLWKLDDDTIISYPYSQVQNAATTAGNFGLTPIINAQKGLTIAMDLVINNPIVFASKTKILLQTVGLWSNGMSISMNSCFMQFSDDLSTISFSRTYSTGNREFGQVADGFRVHYSGNKYGLCAHGNGYVFYPLMFKTQKPMEVSGLSGGTTYNLNDCLNNIYNNCNKYYMYLQSSQGLVAYIPSIPIFLGGYFSIIENPIPVTLQPNSDNYIYIERDSNDRTKIIASSSTTRTINEGDKVFNKILCAKVTTDSANMISVEYYRINTGYNDYSFN